MREIYQILNGYVTHVHDDHFLCYLYGKQQGGVTEIKIVSHERLVPNEGGMIAGMPISYIIAADGNRFTLPQGQSLTAEELHNLQKIVERFQATIATAVGQGMSA